MSTVIRNTISKKSKYYLPKHRYLELKHFCLQYPDWKKEYNSLNGLHDQLIFDPTSKDGIRKAELTSMIEMVDSSARQSDPFLGIYILEAVTTGKSYTYFQMMKNIPCCKDTFYDRYRKFFYILDSRNKHAY